MEQKAIIVSEEAIRKVLTPEDALDIGEKTWRWYSEGKVIMPNKITTDMSSLGVDGWFNSMPAYIGPMNTAGIKLVGGYGKNKSMSNLRSVSKFSRVANCSTSFWSSSATLPIW